MTWESFYLTCFLVGFLLSLVSFLGQVLHFGGGHAHADAGGHGHSPAGHAHGGHVHADGAHHAGHSHAHGAEPEIAKLNFMTITAFLAWFGGTGYLLARYAGIWVWFGFVLAITAGLSGAVVVFWVLKKLLARDYTLDAADFDMVGVLGRVSSPVREAGIGEMVFSQEGSRKAAAIRSDDGRAIGKGAEVVVTKFEKGIAYVRRWDELAGESVAAHR